jgi:hypothetical protein
LADLSDAAQEFRDLARNLTLVGAGELHAELFRAVSDAARPATEAVRVNLDAHMPTRYADELNADLDLSVSRRTGVDTAGVFITARGRMKARKVRRLEGGVLSHPLFGMRHHWYDQTAHVSAGFFNDPIAKTVPQIRDKIIEAMHRVADKATGRP